MTMGERIKYYRTKSDMTQEQLGELLGVQKSAIRKYEKGEVENIKRSTIKRMSEIFDGSQCSYGKIDV
jgi:repressor LexA